VIDLGIGIGAVAFVLLEYIGGHCCGVLYWETEPDVGRVVDGLPCRLDRIKCLGNAVVPIQAKTAFETLMGISI